MRHKAEDPGEKGGIPCVIRTGAVYRRRDVPAVRPDNMSGTDVARYLHAGDEAAHCRRDPGGRRFVPSGPHPHRADAACATRHKKL